MPLQFPPGTKYQYSNAGVNTAGRIIEIVSEMNGLCWLRNRVQPFWRWCSGGKRVREGHENIGHALSNHLSGLVG